jgi:hypothetical protein
MIVQHKRDKTTVTIPGNRTQSYPQMRDSRNRLNTDTKTLAMLFLKVISTRDSAGVMAVMISDSPPSTGEAWPRMAALRLGAERTLATDVAPMF